MRRPHAPRLRLSELDQTTVDTIGLGLVATGLLLGFLLWTGSGAVGESVSEVFRFLVGGVTYLLPLFVIGTGVALAARERLESPARMRAGAIAIALGLALGLAAGSLGLGPGGGETRDLWGVDAMMDRGGVAGEALYWATSTPTACLPGIGARMRMSVDASAYAMSSLSWVTRGPVTRPTIFASTPKWPRLSTSSRAISSWLEVSGPWPLPEVRSSLGSGSL